VRVPSGFRESSKEVAARVVRTRELQIQRHGACNAHLESGATELYALVMSPLANEHMSWDEKVRTVEELWASLTQNESRLDSPPWHRDALEETAARYEAGQEQPVDWAAAKRELRKRAE
jgi:Putative addiction module component